MADHALTLERTDADTRVPGARAGPIDKHVASRVRERRIVLGISQQKLAAALGLTFQQLYKYEQGKNRISAGRLYDLGKVLGVPIMFFFEGVADATTRAGALRPAAAERLRTREAGELLGAYRAISNPILRRSVRRLVRALSAGSNASAAAAPNGDRGAGALRTTPTERQRLPPKEKLRKLPPD